MLTSPHKMSAKPLRLGSRGSVLALWQANWTAEQLQTLGVRTEIAVIQTSGDRVQNESIVNIGAQGVFSKEIQRALLNDEIDLAVHSLKDLPTDPVDGLNLAAVPKRESYRDAFVSSLAARIADLPEGARIGTGSLRRKTQILHHFGGKYRIEDIRGNIETRLRKLETGEYDAIILAEAGLQRLGFGHVIRSVLEPPFFLPAIGQGALGWEIRRDDIQTAEMLQPLIDLPDFAAVRAERAMLRKLQGGCSAPIAALGTIKDNLLTLHGRILSSDGKYQTDVMQSVPITDADILERAEHLGECVGEELCRKNP